MKKVIILFALVSLMVFALSISALGAGSVYFDYIVDGEWEEADLTGFVIGGEYKTDTFKIGFDYLLGEIESEIDLDYTQYILKGGYGINENIFITLSWFDLTQEYIELEATIDGLLLGADLSYDLSEQLTFEGSLGISVTGKFTETDEDSVDADFTALKLKLIYNVSDNIGVAIGYNNISIEVEDNEADLNYMTLGAAYKF
ncbi:MAG: outer membrane beta-barrel protein [Firmicutes bacterium]|nr:outer membrane beta-barrel protein [Bacillota bacterium]